jgi:hypothetical protein
MSDKQIVGEMEHRREATGGFEEAHGFQRAPRRSVIEGATTDTPTPTHTEQIEGVQGDGGCRDA